MAEAAGVNNTLVALHFGSCDALIAAALSWTSEQSISSSRLREAAELGESFTDSLLELLLAEPELQVFQYEMILEARRRPELAEAVSVLYENYANTLADALPASGSKGSVEVVARTLFASLDRLILQFLAGVGWEEIAASLKEVHDVLLLRTGEGSSN